MIICHCEKLNERDVAHAIACGARDEEHLSAACGAASRCGNCLPHLRRLLESVVDHTTGRLAPATVSV
jgi:bacterioferritin-associated ferredoxin